MTLPRTPSFNLKGKRALVTGASSGIGLACATALAEYGAEVTLAARSGDKLEEISHQMSEQGWDVQTLPVDVSDVAATTAAVSQAGPFDILVNSAGLARHSAALETTEEDFDAVADLNFKGAYFLTKAVAQGLVDAGRGGSLINISSQMAKVGVLIARSMRRQSTPSKALPNRWRSNGAQRAFGSIQYARPSLSRL